MRLNYSIHHTYCGKRWETKPFPNPNAYSQTFPFVSNVDNFLFAYIHPFHPHKVPKKWIMFEEEALMCHPKMPAFKAAMSSCVPHVP
jgi:hypothetical protein